MRLFNQWSEISFDRFIYLINYSFIWNRIYKWWFYSLISLFLFIKKLLGFLRMNLMGVTLKKIEFRILFLYIWGTLAFNMLTFILVIKEWFPDIDMYFIRIGRSVLRLLWKWKVLYFHLWTLRLLIQLLITLLIKKGTLYLYLLGFTIIKKWFHYWFTLLI